MYEERSSGFTRASSSSVRLMCSASSVVFVASVLSIACSFSAISSRRLLATTALQPLAEGAVLLVIVGQLAHYRVSETVNKPASPLRCLLSALREHLLHLG